MRIGLIGFTCGHENMGCQALTCSFLEILRRNFPNEKIEIVNFHAENTLGEIPKLFPEFKFSKFRIKMKDIRYPFLKEIKKCDIVFDETFGDGFSDIYFTKNVYRSTLIKYMIGKTKVPFVLTPQTYGPFKHKTLERMAGIAIRSATEVYARDNISAEYATKLSGRHVKVMTDLAFTLPFTPIYRDNNKIRLGLNVSGLLWQGGFSSNNQFGLITDYRAYCKRLIEYALKQDYEVHIIPHVTEPADPNRKVPDPDYPACKELAEEFSQVIIAPCFKTPYEAKNYIASMDYFIGARMHATIGAFSSGVKTISFAYSRKFKGLYESLGYLYYVDGTKVSTDEALKQTIDFIESPEDLEESQKRALIQVVDKNNEFERELVKLIRTTIIH